jgi:small conductance mechanosensitive channel
MIDQASRLTEFALTHGVRLLAIVLIALLLNRVLRGLTKKLVKASDPQSATRIAQMHEQQTRTLAGVLHGAGTFAILLLAIMLALPEFGFSVTPVAAVAGLATLALGFGAQHLIRDVINGFLAVFEEQFVVGDMVRIGDVTGRVEHFTLRRTVLRDAQGAMVTIPNSEIGKVANLSRDWAQVFLDTVVSPGGSVADALSMLEAVSGEFRVDPVWSPTLVDGPRVLGVESLAASGTMLRVQVRTIPNRQDDVARELRRRIRERLG